MSVAVVDQPDLLAAGIYRESARVGDVGQSGCRPGSGLPARLVLFPAQERPDILVGDDGRAEAQALVAVRVIGMPVCVDQDANSLAPGQGFDRRADLVGGGRFHGVDHQDSERVSHDADVASAALKHVDRTRHWRDGDFDPVLLCLNVYRQERRREACDEHQPFHGSFSLTDMDWEMLRGSNGLPALTGVPFPGNRTRANDLPLHRPRNRTRRNPFLK